MLKNKFSAGSIRYEYNIKTGMDEEFIKHEDVKGHTFMFERSAICLIQPIPISSEVKYQIFSGTSSWKKIPEFLNKYVKVS